MLSWLKHEFESIIMKFFEFFEVQINMFEE